MKTRHVLLTWLVVLVADGLAAPQGTILFETISAHHHIRVIDSDGGSPNGLRTLSFDGSMETRMSLSDPTQGHFEYTEHFHMPWLWNGLITNVLVIGLGGASTQRSWARYYPQVTIETVEIDRVVLDVAVPKRSTAPFSWMPTSRIATAHPFPTIWPPKSSLPWLPIISLLTACSPTT
jgi:hypothetical protein